MCLSLSKREIVGTKGVSQNHLLSFDDNKVLKLSIGYAKHLFKVYRILIKVSVIEILIEQVKEQRNLLKLKASEENASEEYAPEEKRSWRQVIRSKIIRSYFTRSVRSLTKYSVRSVQPLTLRMSLQPLSLHLVSTSRQE